MLMQQPLVDVQHLTHIYGESKSKRLRAVDDISFSIQEGETFGLVGESGCGKTTTGRMLVQLLDATSGSIRFDGRDIATLRTRRERLAFRQNAQIIFQDPYASLDPRKKVRDIVAEGIQIHGLAKSREDRDEQVAQLLDAVGLRPEHMTRYPHEFSGGQRQRIGIARALATRPRFVVCDEPISALDVSIQAQVVNLLKQLQQERGLTYLFIAHDLSMVKYISDRIGVMYRGKIVEMGSADEVYQHPLHPYTRSLISAIPLPDPRTERTRARIPYSPPDSTENWALREVRPGHLVYCGENGETA
ncbi:MAG: ATP-binding cassette domain-containing protein [Clostridia bacterium]|nr:ATP-binding cassette domain-containing protein [Clostridia bacterium]